MKSTPKTFLILMMTALFWCCSTQPTVYNSKPALPYDDSGLSQATRDTIWDDAARLALEWALSVNPSYEDSINIPVDRIKLHYRDLVSFYNSSGIPARDSILDKYHIHGLDPQVRLLTINAPIGTVSDSIIAVLEQRYNLELVDSSFHIHVKLRTSKACNISALTKQMAREIPNLGIQPVGWASFTCLPTITDSVRSHDRMYSFIFCPGELLWHEWQLSVDDNGSVHYLGSYGDPLH